ncbi:MAG TPA: hypothetical protein VLI89_09140, partial [Burkholderiales bacterium]|nr:hypothetical protein [Burkholderiales bacterium]
MEIAVVLLLGLVIGTAAGWFFRSRATAPDVALMAQRAEQAESQLAEARELAAEVHRSRDVAQAELREESARRAAFEALAAGIPDMNREIEARSMSIAQLQRTVLEVTRDREALAATIEAERRGFEAKLKLLEDAKRALSDAFNALSANALRSNSEEFLKLAQTSVAPVREALAKFE